MAMAVATATPEGVAAMRSVEMDCGDSDGCIGKVHASVDGFHRRKYTEVDGTDGSYRRQEW